MALGSKNAKSNSPKIRSEFPETWLWDLQTVGYVGYFLLQLNCNTRFQIYFRSSGTHRTDQYTISCYEIMIPFVISLWYHDIILLITIQFIASHPTANFPTCSITRHTIIHWLLAGYYIIIFIIVTISNSRLSDILDKVGGFQIISSGLYNKGYYNT